MAFPGRRLLRFPLRHDLQQSERRHTALIDTLADQLKAFEGQ
ncbi:hypothetical protein [Streptomyces sp. NBC_01435]|nr:hypothetical protein [Streptomyces sp. NBC_01435]